MKKNYFVFLIPAFLFCNIFVSKSQDIHFSQYQQTSPLINPALTGALSVLRATLIYKEQWRSVTVPYSTYGISIENRFQMKGKRGAGYSGPKTKSFRRFAAGLSVYSDKAGDGAMGITQANLSISAFIPTGDNSAISGGLQGSMFQRKIDFAKLVFPDQYNGTGYDVGLSSGESPASQNFTYADFAGGLNWNYGFSESLKEADANVKANIGASVYHVSQPKQDYLSGSTEKIERKFILHADFLIGLSSANFALAPSIICVLQGPSKEIIEGLMLKYYFIEGPRYYGVKASSAFGFGLSYRNRDAAIASFLFEYGHYAIGVSYDLNTSMLNTASKVKGGPEVFLRYVAPNQFGVNHKPKRRYNL